MPTLDKLKAALDSGQVAVLGTKGAPDASYIERVGHRYVGVVANEDIEVKDFEGLLERLRVKDRPTYDPGWSAAWQVVSQRDALQWIQRPLSWYVAAAGMNENLLIRQAQVGRAALQHINDGRPIAVGVATRICDVLSREFGREIKPEDIRGLKIC